MEYVEKYRRAFLELGLAFSGDDGIHEPVGRSTASGFVLPLALADYYSACGQHEVNRWQNRFLPPQELYVADNRLVFMEEVQGAISWGILPSEAPDPEVWQGVKAVGDPRIYWYSEELALSDFIVAMWRWQITGDEPQRVKSD